DAMSNRIILAIELIILCGPAVSLLTLGALYLPALLMGSVSGTGDWRTGAAIILCGVWGSISLANLAWHTFSESNWPGRPTQWLGITTGLTVCAIGLSIIKDSVIMFFIFLGPIIATAHLLYLSKSQKLEP
ncbi:hypothetical protein AAGT13_12730, partial [Azotobacter salinestris]